MSYGARARRSRGPRRAVPAARRVDSARRSGSTCPALTRPDAGSRRTSTSGVPRDAGGAASIAARHTVGMADPLDATTTSMLRRPRSTHCRLSLDRGDRALPPSLLQGQASRRRRGGCRATAQRSRACSSGCARYAVTLDGNEQFPDAATSPHSVAALRGDTQLARLVRQRSTIEQPFSPRESTLDTTCVRCWRRRAADHRRIRCDARRIPAARTRGYSGVSSKNCKGFCKSLARMPRAARWNAAEDRRAALLHVRRRPDGATRASPLQQDLALAALLGITHVERNGHHLRRRASPDSRRACASRRRSSPRHPDLYGGRRPRARSRSSDGRIALAFARRSRLRASAAAIADPMPAPPIHARAIPASIFLHRRHRDGRFASASS